MDLRWEILAGYGPLFVSGLLTTIELTVVSIGAGLLLGVVLGLISSSKDAPQPKARLPRLGLQGLQDGDHGLCHLLPGHAAVRADPAGALRRDAGAGAPGHRLAARR